MPNILSLPPPPRQMPAPRQQGGLDSLMGGGGANAMIPILLALLQNQQSSRRFDLEQKSSERRIGLEEDALEMAKQRAGQETDVFFQTQTNPDFAKAKEQGIKRHESALGEKMLGWDKDREEGKRRAKPIADQIRRWAHDRKDLKEGIANIVPRVRGLLNNLPGYFGKVGAVQILGPELLLLESRVQDNKIDVRDVRGTIDQFDSTFKDYSAAAERIKLQEFNIAQEKIYTKTVDEWEIPLRNRASSQEYQNLAPGIRRSRFQEELKSNALSIPFAPYEFERPRATGATRPQETTPPQEEMGPVQGVTSPLREAVSTVPGAAMQEPQRRVQRTKGFKETWREGVLGAEESAGEWWGGTGAPPIKFLSGMAYTPAIFGGLLSSLFGGGEMGELTGKSPELSQTGREFSGDQGGYDDLLGGLEMGPPTEEEMLLQLFGQPSIPMTRGGF